jgi:cyclophilin family peptidyl-prolyl cis-trans isomerase
MRSLLPTLAGLLLVAGALAAQEPAPPEPTTTGNPRMVLDTTEGVIVVELYPEQAPKTVENITRYVEQGFYDGTIFHRVISGFMIQGGGYGQDLVKKEVGEPVVNEADNGLRNERGTVAMARMGDPHSATAQFYVNLVDNVSLDHTGKSDQGWGYCVFGRVVEGMNVVDRIARTRTQTKRGLQNVPMLPIVIERATIRTAGSPG